MQFIPFIATTNTTTAAATSTTEVLNQARSYTYCKKVFFSFVRLKKYICGKNNVLLLLQEESIVNYDALSTFINLVIIIIIIIINSRGLGVVRVS